MSSARDGSAGRDQRLHEVIAAYLEAVRAGRAPDRQELFARYPDLAEELRAFLADHDRVGALAHPAAPSPVGAEAPTRTPGATAAAGPGTPPRTFGDYELLDEVARGGMGVVFKARQKSLDRVVALKMILAGEFAAAADVERFRTEARAAAGLEHPGIVSVYEVGEHEGRHYFTMQLVDGASLSHKVADLSGDPRAAARLVAQVARAVHFAHQHGVLHRDLKPANVLVDREGQAHVTDFGLARRLDGAAGLTRTGAIVGTPSYMAPEQAAGKKGLTTAADVYGLGALLYECLTGRPPFRAETPLDTLLLVLEKDPEPPRRLNPGIDRDLETIALKCLEKDPRRRYESAAAVADDLEHWLRGEPIRGRRTALAERAWKWARRRPERALLAALAAVALVAGLGWAARQGLQYRERLRAEEKDRRDRDEAEARQRKWDEEQQRESRRRQTRTDLAQGLTLCEGGRVGDGMLTWARGLRLAADAGDEDLQLQLRRQLGRWRRRLPRLLALVPWEFGPGEDGGREQVVPEALYLTQQVAWSADGTRLAFAGGFHHGRLWDLTAGRPVGEPLTDGGSIMLAVAFRPDGKVLVSGSQGGARLWDAVTGRPLKALPGVRRVELARFSPDGKRLLTAQPAQLRDAATGQPVGQPLQRRWLLSALAFRPDGQVLATADGRLGDNSQPEGDVRLWDAATGAPRGEPLPQPLVTALEFSPDGKLLAAGGWGGTRLWGPEHGKPVGGLLAQFGQIRAVAFSPDGKTLLTTSNGPRLWDVATGQPRTTELNAPGGIPYLAVFGPDGKTFATATGAGLYQWDTASGRLLGGVEHHGNVPPAGWSFSPDHRRFAMLGVRECTRVEVWDDAERRGYGIGTEYTFHGVVWELPAMPPAGARDDSPLEGSAEHIALWLQVWTGRDWSPEGSYLINLPADVWQQRRQRLDERGGPPP
jgi:dipeptidyl aminopeptidase/acylaminoacyl peptidase